MRAYLEQFTGDTSHDIYQLNTFQDVRVYELLVSAGLTTLPDFSWTTFPIPYQPDNLQVAMISRADHETMIALIKAFNNGEDFNYEIVKRDWFLSFNHHWNFSIHFEPDGAWWLI